MNCFKIELPEGANVLLYQLRSASNNRRAAVIMPVLSVSEGKRYFEYRLEEYSPVFNTRVSKADLISAETEYMRVAHSLGDSLLDGERLLFSEEAVYRDSLGSFAFLYYPADPVPSNLQDHILQKTESIQYENERTRDREINSIAVYTGFAVFCYSIYLLLLNSVAVPWLIAILAYAILCIAHLWLPHLDLINRGARDTNMPQEETPFIPEPICFRRQREECALPIENKDNIRASIVSIFDSEVKYEMDGNVFRIGRNVNLVNLYIPDERVNPIHAEIIREGEDFYIIDKCSRNGTYINDVKIEPENRIPLYGSEEIRVGEEIFGFYIS